MEKSTIVGIDIGTTKICTLVAEVDESDFFRIIGVGIVPSRGMRRGVVTDLSALTEAITHSIAKAQRSSAYEIRTAIISLAGSQVSSINNRGSSGVANGIVSQTDINRAMESAQSIAIPHNREVIHVIKRGFTLDGQESIHKPIGMDGFRLEVEVHIITSAANETENLRKCVQAAGVKVEHLILNPLASGEVVLNDNEKELGVMVCDIGGGTTDIALYINGSIWHTAIKQIGGSLITSDIATGLRLPMQQAEDIKKKYGHAVQEEISKEDYLTIKPFGEDSHVRISRNELAMIIEARVEEIFEYVHQEIRRSGYDSLLPAGVVLTGGSSLLPGIRTVASRVLDLPVRIAKPEDLHGLVDQLDSPAFATSIGLLKWSLLINSAYKQNRHGEPPSTFGNFWQRARGFLKKFDLDDQEEKKS